MNRTTRNILTACLLPLAMTGCKNFDDLRVNPNVSVVGTPKLLLTGLEMDMIGGQGSAKSGFSSGSDLSGDMSNSPWNYTHMSNQFLVLGHDYYGSQDYTWNSGSSYYGSLRNAAQLDIEAAKQGPALAAPYYAVNKFIRTFYFLSMTSQMGDIPMSEAIKGATDAIYAPRYDAQKDVFLQCFKWMEEANDSLAAITQRNAKATVDGDIFYAGNLLKWRKAINTCYLRELMNLSIKENDPALDLKGRFNRIISNPEKYPLILENADNLQMNYNASQKSNNYPLYPMEVGILSAKRNALSSTYINILDSLRDPRVFIVAAPADSLPAVPGNPFARYKGANTGDRQDQIYIDINKGKYSTFNISYWLSSPAGVPNIQLGAAETHFLIAEAIIRGWIGGDAAQHYKDGITASMKFYGVSDANITTFLAQPVMQYAGNNDAGLKQVLTQKYVAFFNNAGWQAYYNYRRTGVPVFSVGPSNQNGGKIPLRFTYAQSEYQNNKANLQEALKRQFGGSDTRNDVMWMLKP